MSGFRSPTVIAALVIAAGMVLTALIVSRALKRFGRGLTEMARAASMLSEELKKQNQTATTVASIQSDLEQLWSLVHGMDGFLNDMGGAIRKVPGIDRYLQQVDGEKYIAALSGGAVPSPQELEPAPPAMAPPLQQAPPAAMPPEGLGMQTAGPYGDEPQQEFAGPNPRYPKLPFDPMDQTSIEHYLASLLPEGVALNEMMPKEAAQGYGSNYTWRQWACARVNMQFAEAFEEYNLPPLGSDMTMRFRRMEIPGDPLTE